MVMDFVKKRKGKSILLSLLLGMIPVFFGIVCLLAGEAQLLLKRPENLYDVPQDRLEGAYVTADLPILYGAYAYEEETENDRPTGKIRSMEYMIDANADSFCGLLISGEDLDKAEVLMSESNDYWEGIGEIPAHGFTVTGVMKPMEGASLNFYKEALDYDSLTDAEQAMFLTLYLDTRAEPNWVVIGIGAALFACAVGMVVYAAAGRYQKDLLDAADALSGGNPEMILEQAAQLWETEPVCKGLWVGSRLVLLEQGLRQYLCESKDICWAYPEVTRQRLYGVITIAKHHMLVLRTLDGKRYAFAMPEKKVNQAVETLDKLLPGCVTGYSGELEKLYNQNRGQLAQIAALRHSNQNR